MNNRMSMTCSSSSSSSGCSSAAVLAGAGLLPFRLLAGPNACPAPTQPIVYYAQVPQLYGKKQKGQEIKNKPNHFVKAFHWYKREHCANKKTAVDKFDIGFATWLDHKYEQYLRDKSMLDTNFKSEASNVQTPTVNQDVGFYKSAKPKGLRRVLKRYKESWHTILRPKSLSRIESLSCAQ
ncbi:uncharacterized protein LOC134678103 [Cydia fagiglandana]|uniref:uncharacterized protein LOC134678103 n=1 Tax=Cydia fagiglandana TaxID=1458189 RepID=UPI002FEE2905